MTDFNDEAGVATHYVEALERLFLDLRVLHDDLSDAEGRTLLQQARQGRSQESYWQWLRSQTGVS